MRLQFPEGFLLGVSSASAQIEGGEVGSSWNDWYHQGKIKDGSDPAVANDHWNRWREDCALMAGLHLSIARIGVEWARIMPSRGEVDETAIAHYRAELAYMHQLGIRPLLTIHHFSNPMWFERLGGFAKRENLDDFLSFAQLCADRFGDLVSDWITINEPNVYATNGVHYVTAKENDTFENIGRKFRISPRNLRKFNDLKDKKAQPVPGEAVYIERKRKRWEGNSRHHICRQGETAYSVGQSYAIRTRSIEKLNKLGPGEELEQGRQIRIK